MVNVVWVDDNNYEDDIDVPLVLIINERRIDPISRFRFVYSSIRRA